MKKVLVTGASGGIGKAICLYFIEKGWQVFGTDIVSSELEHNNFKFYLADISTTQNIKELVSKIEQETKSLDALVNNAAIQISKPFSEITEQDWDETMNLNLKSVFFLTQKMVSLLRQSQGSVVNIASVHAIATSKNISAYAISKSAIVGLTKSLAIELAEDNIRVNSVLPAAIDTPMLRSGLRRGHLFSEDDEGLLKELGQKHVLGRVGSTEEVAKAAYFLADNTQSSFVTGTSFVLDGGATIKLSTE
ncbi:SDR family NAD(P)-dependent oxidoreductase [Bernardetia sp.]|uniref:SDR family NAD(P)-dependent oxidoreductase n=1 Tax=Bernardetia sp. TaxID=1937974 RepID=UPI0025C1DF7B|nr:SDR family oxidoreductase [Bernardetia sp.]